MFRKLVALSSFTFAAVAIVSAVACSSSSAPAASSNDANATKNDAGDGNVANGQIGDWQTLAPMPLPRANHCSVVANGFLVVIGGNYEPEGSSDFVSIDEVDVAQIQSDGSIGEWKSAGKMPAPVNSCTAVASGNTLIVLDGIYDPPSGATSSPYEGVPQIATIGDDGTVSAFTNGTALPNDVRVLYSTAIAQAGTVYTMFSDPTGEGNVSLLTAPLTASGLGSFTTIEWFPEFLGHPQYAFAPPYFFAIGGYDATDAGNDVLASGAGMSLDQHGNASKPFSIASLTTPTAFGAAVAIDSWVFVIGGKNGVFSGEGSTNVFAGAIDANGNISAWNALAKMPAGRTSLSVAAGGDFIYVTGGGDKGSGLDSVFAVQARFAP